MFQEKKNILHTVWETNARIVYSGFNNLYSINFEKMKIRLTIFFKKTSAVQRKEIYKSNSLCYNNCERFDFCLQILFQLLIFETYLAKCQLCCFILLDINKCHCCLFYRVDDCAILFLRATSVYYCANGNVSFCVFF